MFENSIRTDSFITRSTFGYEPIENGEEPLADLNKAPLSTLQDYQGAKIQKALTGNEQANSDLIKGGDNNKN